MMFDFVNEITLFVQKSELYIKPWLAILGIIWCVNIINWLLGSKLNILGIYPRSGHGIIGILFSPFLHQNIAHLIFNSVPLFILGLVILASKGVITFCWITVVIALLEGIGVWLFGRKGLHIGASGIISGYFGYILMLAYAEPSVITIVLAVLAIYYFGGILLGLFPTQKAISWEAHLFGFLAGVLCAHIPNGFSIIHSAHFLP